MKTKILTILLFLMILSQLLVPVYTIVQKESVLKNGVIYKFKCRPTDPYNPFKGRYVYLNFENDYVETSNIKNYNSGDPVYVTLINDTNGFAKFNTIFKTKPASKDYIKTKVNYIEYEGTKVYLQLPFNEYYMDEKKAPNAEELVAKMIRIKSSNVYAEVKVLDGQAVIQNLYVDQKRIEDAIK